MRAADATPLAAVLAERIARDGPMSVRDYMDACLHHPEYGYYRTRAAIGAQADFITAPEISQVFGELIGLWAAVAWQQMGTPARVRLVELGPGRGTLMRDALRAARAVPAFRAAVEVVLVEPNPVLAAVQRDALAEAGVALHWCTSIDEVGTGESLPTILIANEVLDVVPIAQYQRTEAGWVERGVGVNDAGRLVFGVAHPAELADGAAIDARPGDIVERRDTRMFTGALRRLADGGALAALFIDYGYEGPAVGDTLQAVRGQRYEDPLAAPGAADVTAHVDFAAFAAEVRAVALAVDGPRTQAAFLGSLGVVERASRLMAANPAAAGTIETAMARLIAPTGMGAHFKAIGVRSSHLPPLAGFQTTA